MKTILFGGKEHSRSTDAALTFLRMFAGFSLAFAHGLDKWPASEGFIAHVEELGFPLPVVWAWAAVVGEAIASLCMGLGLFTRLSAFMMGATMFVAAVINHADDPYGAAEKAYLYLAISLLFVWLGAGRYSLDGLVRKKYDF